MNPMRVVAIVVTHNRCELLSRCLDNISKQSRPPDEILVINNGSTDDTESMLASRKIQFITQDNLGAAAGWYLGLEYAIQNKFDAAWLMDDDGYPDLVALSLLERHLINDQVVCASSVVLREEKNLFVFPFPIINNQHKKFLFNFFKKYKSLSELKENVSQSIYPFAHFFNGALISMRAVNKIGNVDKRYFIYGDEVDYYQRLKSIGSVVSVIEAYHFHPDVSRRQFNSLKAYYYIRNSLILDGKYSQFSHLKQAARIFWVMSQILKRNSIGFLVILILGRDSGIFYKAILHGLSGKLGQYNYFKSTKSP